MIALFPVVVALVVPVNEPIVRRADRPDSAYCQPGSHARSLVSIGRAGDGTLIGSRLVLTPGHVARSLALRQPAMRSVSIDAPPGGTDLEGAPGPGDSGGTAPITPGLSAAMKLRFAVAVLLANVAG